MHRLLCRKKPEQGSVLEKWMNIHFYVTKVLEQKHYKVISEKQILDILKLR